MSTVEDIAKELTLNLINRIPDVHSIYVDAILHQIKLVLNKYKYVPETNWQLSNRLQEVELMDILRLLAGQEITAAKALEAILQRVAGNEPALPEVGSGMAAQPDLGNRTQAANPVHPLLHAWEPDFSEGEPAISSTLCGLCGRTDDMFHVPRIKKELESNTATDNLKTNSYEMEQKPLQCNYVSMGPVMSQPKQAADCATVVGPKELQTQIDGKRFVIAQMEAGISKLVALLQGACDHSKTSSYRWEFDDGYGRQHMNEGRRCKYCGWISLYNDGRWAKPKDVTV